MTFTNLTSLPEIKIRLGGEWSRVAESEDGHSLVMLGENFPSPPLGTYKSEYLIGNELLSKGASISQLRNEVLRNAGPIAAGGYVLFLSKLTDWGFTEFFLADESGECAVIHPQQPGFVPNLARDVPNADAEISRFALLRRDSGKWLLESPLCAARFAFSDPEALERPIVRRALAGTGFIDDEANWSEQRRTALKQWEFHDLQFHNHSRLGSHRDPFGGIFPYIDEIAPLPAVRPKWEGRRIPLSKAPEEIGTESFASVLGRRRSERLYDESKPITCRDLGALLDRVARIKSQEAIAVQNYWGGIAEFEVSRRPYPTGGASYELEIYPVVNRSADIESGIYHYDPEDHELVNITGRTVEVEWIVSNAKQATANFADPQIVLVITARFARVMWKYKSIAYGVILRNCGSLYQTLYLGATELGLSPCGIGSGSPSLFAQATGMDPIVEGSVGEFIIGGTPLQL